MPDITQRILQGDIAVLAGYRPLMDARRIPGQNEPVLGFTPNVVHYIRDALPGVDRGDDPVRAQMWTGSSMMWNLTGNVVDGWNANPYYRKRFPAPINLNYIVCLNTDYFGTSMVIADDIPNESTLISSGPLTGCTVCCLWLDNNCILFAHTGSAGAPGNYLQVLYNTIAGFLGTPAYNFANNIQVNSETDIFIDLILANPLVRHGVLMYRNHAGMAAVFDTNIHRAGHIANKRFRVVTYPIAASCYCLRPCQNTSSIHVLCVLYHNHIAPVADTAFEINF